jgi:hypothetical protein
MHKQQAVKKEVMLAQRYDRKSFFLEWNFIYKAAQVTIGSSQHRTAKKIK